MTSRISAMIQSAFRSWNVRSKINHHRLSLSDCASVSDIEWLTYWFDKLSSLLISFIIVNKWFNSVISRDRSAIVRFCRRAENFKSFSIPISTQRNYFHSKWSQQTVPRLFLNCPMALYGAIETLHDTEQNRTHPSRNILRDRHLKVNKWCPGSSLQPY